MADKAYYSKYFRISGANYSDVPTIELHQYLESGTEENVNATVYYRYNTNTQLWPGAWQQWNRSSGKNLILTVPSNIDYVEFKSLKSVWGNTTRHLRFEFGGSVDISGNIMSLCYGDEFYGKKVFKTEQENGIFYKLFYGASINSAENLVLPVTHYETTTPTHCYDSMFKNSIIVEGPQIDLRSTDSGYFCANMFSGSNLKNFTTNLQGGTNNYYECVANTPTGTVYNYSGTNIRDQLNRGTGPGSVIYYKNAPILATAYIQYDRVLEIIQNDKQITTLKKNNSSFYNVAENDKSKYFRIYNNTSYSQTITFKKSSTAAPNVVIKYLNDVDVLTELGTTSTTGLTYSLNPGKSLYIMSTASTWGSSTSDYNYITGCTYIDGNLNALTNYNKTNNNYKFCNLFSQCQTLINAENITVYPGTGTRACYKMFYGLTNLEYAPGIDCDTLGEYSLLSCFEGCTSIKKIFLYNIFSCGNRCFERAFYGCSSLNKINYGAYSDTTISDNTFYEWVYGVAASGDFYRIITQELSKGISGIPIGWNDIVSPVIITRL